MSDAGPIHATCVAVDGRGLLILGASGAGKSRLALEMIALGATLVADDRTALARRDGGLLASAPPALAGLIEARGVGLLRLPHASDVPVAAALDLDAAGTERLPPRRSIRLIGAPVALMVRPAALSAGLMLAVMRAWPPLDPDP